MNLYFVHLFQSRTTRLAAISAFGFFYFLTFSFSVRTACPKSEPIMVRIAVSQGEQMVVVQARGRYQMIDPKTGAVIEEGRRLSSQKIDIAKERMRINGKPFYLNAIRYASDKDVTLLLQSKKRRFRGEIDVFIQNGKLLVVNRINLEDYIKGVLYHEVSHRWPMDALKAQAVAARTYAVYQIKKNKSKAFDVSSDIYSQVYGGRDSERYRTNLAVDGSRGEILLYKGLILPAYFHACCGGSTEDAKELWNHDLPPLRGVKSLFCRDSPHYFWRKNMRLKDIQDKLNENGYKIGPIKEIHVSEYNRSERVRSLEITTRDGKVAVFSGKDFRQIIGPNVIRSNKYFVEMKGYYCDFVGKGWGHGVGMCQWCANGMARARYSYQEILFHFYPGTEMVSLESVDIGPLNAI